MMSPTPGGSILIDVGAEVAEQLAGERTGDERAELEHAQPARGALPEVVGRARHGQHSRVHEPGQRGGHNGLRTERPRPMSSRPSSSSSTTTSCARPSRSTATQREESGDPHFPPPVMEELKTEARKRDLWNLFMPEGEHGAGLVEPRLRAAVRGDGRSPLLVRSDELLGARHRQHGDPRPVRHAAAAGAVAAARCSTARSARASR